MIEINLSAEKYFTLPEERKALRKDVKINKELFIKNAISDLKKFPADS